MGKIDVFISHSSGNRDVTESVYRTLKGAGVNCWVSYEDLVGGQQYATEIAKVMNECKVVVVIFSKESSESEWVKSEVNLAFSAKKIIMPFIIDDTDISKCGEFILILQLAHRINAQNNWKNKLEELTKAVRGALSLSEISNISPVVITPKKKISSIAMVIILAIVICCGVVGAFTFLKSSEKIETEPTIEQVDILTEEPKDIVIEEPKEILTEEPKDIVVKNEPTEESVTPQAYISTEEDNTQAKSSGSTSMASKANSSSKKTVSDAVIAEYDKGVTAYDNGNYQQAIGCFEVAGEAGHLDACYKLVEIYTSGVGNISSNKFRARKWSDKAKKLSQL